MFRRAQIMGFFLLLVALLTGTTWLAQADDNDSPEADSPATTAPATTAPSTSQQAQPTTVTTSGAVTTESSDTTRPSDTTEPPVTTTIVEPPSTETTIQPTSTLTIGEPTTSATTEPPTTDVSTTSSEPTTTAPSTTEPTTTTTEAQPATVKVSGQAGLRLGNSVAPGPNLLRLNFFDQATDERLQSVVYTGLTNTGDYSADLRTDITYRVDVIVCCNAPTVTLSFRDLSFDQATTLNLTVPAVEVVFEVVSEAGSPVSDVTIVIPAASGSNAQATWSARVFAPPTDQNGETRTVLPIGTSSTEDRLPTLTLADGVKTTFQFEVLGGNGDDAASDDDDNGDGDPVTPTTTTLAPGSSDSPTTTANPTSSTEPATTEPATTEPATTSGPTTTEPGPLAPESTTSSTLLETTTSESTLLVLLEGDLDDTETTLPETTQPETTLPETTLPETTLPETTLPETTLPETTLPDGVPVASSTTGSPTTEPPATVQEEVEPATTTTIISTTSTPGPSPATTTADEQPTTTQPDSPTTASPDTASPGNPANPEPIEPTPDGSNTVRIVLVAPTSLKLSGKAGLEILGELTPGSHSLRINFYRAGTDELGAQVTYTGESNDGSFQTHLIAGAAYRVEVIVCCEGPTIRFVYDNLVFTESAAHDFLVPAAKFVIKVVDHEDAAIDDATIVFDELAGTTSTDETPWYASGRPQYDTDSTSFAVILPIGSVASTDLSEGDIGPTSLIIDEAEPVSFTVPNITFNINTLLIKLNEDKDSIAVEPELTRPWVTPTLSVEANEAGWINSEAEITWAVTDPEPEVGLSEFTLAPTPVDKEGTHTYWSDEACDLEENCSKGSLEVSLDSQAPSVGIHGFVKGAFRETVPTPTCTAEDSGSGLLLITADDDEEEDADDDEDGAANKDEKCSLETRVLSSEIIAEQAGDSDEGTNDSDEGTNDSDEGTNDSDEGTNDTDEGTNETDDAAQSVRFLTTYEVTATATDIAGNVTTVVETYQMETEEQAEITAVPPTTSPPTTSPPTTVPTTSEPTTTDQETTTVPEPAEAPSTDQPATTSQSTTTPETIVSETTPETTVVEPTTTESAPDSPTTSESSNPALARSARSIAEGLVEIARNAIREQRQR